MFVQSNGSNLDIAQVTAGGAATLTAPQDISSTGSLVPAVQTGGDLTLDAQSGDLRGSVSRALVIRVGGILRAAAAGNQVWLTQDTGNLTFDVISAGTTVTVGVSNGSLFQHSTGIGIPFGTNLTLTASGGIGTLAQPVTGQIDPAGTVTATAGGDLYYSEIGNDLHIGTITSTGGSVRLESDLSIVDAATTSAHTLANNSITLIADHGSLGSQTNHLNIDSRRGGVSGVVNASSSFGDAYVDETSGDIYLGTVGASGAGTETDYLQALSGNIFNGLASGANVTAPNVWLSATGAIGAAGAGHSVETVVSNVAARAFGGGIWLDNTGPLFVGGVDDATGATPANALQATGPITVSVHSPLTVGANVLAGGDILFTTADNSADDDIVLLPAVQVTSTGGSIELDAGDNITISPTSTISAAGSVTFRGDYGNGDGLPTAILLQGDLSGTTIDVYGGPANDTITLRLHSLVGHVQVFGGDGADFIWVDGLPNLDVANTCTTNPCGDPSTLNTGHNGNRQTVDLDGQGGGDTYFIQTTDDTSYIVNVHDSGAANDGVDSLVIDGTNNDDEFLLRAQFVSKLDANSVVERINYDDSVNTLQVNGYSESTGVDAPDGNDSFYVDDNSALTVLDGGTGDDTFQFGQMFGADRQPPDVAPGDEIATVDTTVGWLSRGISYSTVAYGGDGEDTFTVYSNKATLKLFGEDGDDTFVVRAFIILDPNTGLSTNQVATSDTLLNGGAGDDHIEYNVNAPVSIDGGAGTDTVVVIGTEQADNFVVTQNGIMGAGLNVAYTNVERVELDGLEGDDHFYILSTDPNVVTTIVGGLGSDTIDVGGDVQGQVVALSTDGVSGFINHSVSSDDPAYNGIFADGVQLNVATGNAGEVVLDTTASADQIIENGSGGTDQSSYALSLASPPSAGSVAYVTVSATGDSNKYAQAGGGSILLSTDGVNWSQSLILTFDNRGPPNASTDPNRTVTIYYRAVSDTVEEGPQTVIIQSSVSSTDPTLDRAEVSNVEVKVIDDDKPGLVISQSDGNTSILEGDTTGDSYTVHLTKAPDAGETVTVSLGYDSSQLHVSSDALTFTSSDWNVDQTITVTKPDNGVPENELFRTITHTIATTGGVYTEAVGQDDANNVSVDIHDADAGGVIVTQTGGSTLVAPGKSDSYSLRLTKAPTSDVYVEILTDGKTIVSEAPNSFPILGNPGTQIGSDGHPYVTFTPTNWFLPQSITVNANPSYVPGSGDTEVQTFALQPHTLDEMFGPLLIDGGQIEDRSLKQGVHLPTEIDSPLPVLTVSVDESLSTDTLNIYDDGSVLSTTDGVLSTIDSTEASTLDSVYKTTVDPTAFGHLVGLGLGDQDLSFSDGETFEQGITYHDIEVVNLLLGQGDDTFHITGTPTNSLTVVQGGGGNDTLIATGGGGPSSPLILLGDTTQDGSFYNTTAATPQAQRQGRDFIADSSSGGFGNDVIDASADPYVVAEYGGPGNDILMGGAGNDILVGGSGDDTIYGNGGNDQIFGDDGMNLDLSHSISTATNQIVAIVDTPTGTELDTGDPLVAGNDHLYGGDGTDYLLGDFGVVAQTPGTQRLTDTGDVTSVYSTRTSEGGNDYIDGGAGNDVAIGGLGVDTLEMGEGNNVSFGDNGQADFRPSDEGFLDAFTTDSVHGADDVIDATGSGINVAFGGRGSDQIHLGNGQNTVFGDDGYATFNPDTDIPLHAYTTDPGVGDNDFIDAQGQGVNVAFGGPGADTITIGDATTPLLTGNNTVFGDDGEAFFDGVTGVPYLAQTTNPGDGFDDHIVANGIGVTVAFGGPGTDYITLGDGTNTAFGDDGLAEFGPTGIPTYAVSTNPTDGAHDEITAGGDGVNVAFGGAGDDLITTGRGTNTVFGDIGYAYFDANGIPTQAGTILALDANGNAIGGVDTIDANGTFETVVFGGPQGDLINGGSGHNTIFGDDGYATFVNGIVTFAQTTDPGIGGDDSIMLGSEATCERNTTQATSSSGSPIDVVFGGPGNDCIKTGDGTNTVFGDDGLADFDPTTGIPYHAETTYAGDGGDDYIVAQSQGETVAFGGPGTDTIIGGAGNNTIFGDDGEADLVQGTGIVTHAETTNPGDGATDYISTTGESADVIFGGPGGDQIVAGSGNNDVVFGDDGEADLDPTTGVLAHGETTNPGDGGADTITTTGTGINVIFGGTASDTITLSGTRNIVFGDDGEVDPTLDSTGHLQSYAHISPLYSHDGAADTITVTGNGVNYIVGENGSDQITSNGNADNLIFGDFGSFDGVIPLALLVPTAPVPFTYTSVFTQNSDLQPSATDPSASNDVITATGSGRSIVFGGQGADLITTGSGNDDVAGGSNVPGANDGADVISTGAGDDVVCGDNCSILPNGLVTNTLDRTLTGPTIYSAVPVGDGTYVYLPNIAASAAFDPLGSLERTVVLFDGGLSPTAVAANFGNDVIDTGDGNDLAFGQMGNDSIWAGAGDDYVEGGGGNDLIFGGAGQDILIGGSSDLFGYTTPTQRALDGTDTIYGDDGTGTGINDPGDTSANGHEANADVIAGDNAEIVRLVSGTQYLQFAYDNYGANTEHIVPSAVTLLDYSPYGDTQYTTCNPLVPDWCVTVPGTGLNIGAADFLYGESGNDTIYGETGDDRIYGGGQDDTLYGNSGADWIDGGTGDDGILGDDGLLELARNGVAEPLYGLAATTQVTLSTGDGDANDVVVTVGVTGHLTYTAIEQPFWVGGNDVIYGGLGDDFLHGGAGDDAMSGAEALPNYYYGTNGDPLQYLRVTLAAYYTPGDPLGFDYYSGMFRYFDPTDPFAKIMVDPAGTIDFLLNFVSATDFDPADYPNGVQPVVDDGQDVLFGDAGNDWLVGGTNTDFLFGGWGNDLLQGDDNLDSTKVTTLNGQPVTYTGICTLATQYSTSSRSAANLCSDLTNLETHLYRYRSTSDIDHQVDQIAEEIEGQIGDAWTTDEVATLVRLLQVLKPDYSPLSNDVVDPRGTAPGYGDVLYGGDGWDILIANTTADRLLDWHDGTNAFYYPWEGNDQGIDIDHFQPGDVPQFLLDLSLALGADPTRPELPFDPRTYPTTWEGQRDWQAWMSWTGWSTLPGWHGWGSNWADWNGWNGWFDWYDGEFTNGEPFGELSLFGPNQPNFWWYGPGFHGPFPGPWPGWCGPGPFPAWNGPWCTPHDYPAWHGQSVWGPWWGGNLENPGIRMDGQSDMAGREDIGSLQLPVLSTPSAKLSQIDDIWHLDDRGESLLHRIVIRGQLTAAEAAALSPWDADALRELLQLHLVTLVGGVYVPTDSTWLQLGLADPPHIATTSVTSTLSAGITLSGTGDVGDTITIYDGSGSTVLGTTLVGADGTWQITVFPVVGRHTLTATETVNELPHVGLTSGRSNQSNDTVLPDAPAITFTSIPGPTTSHTSVTVSGTGTPGYRITLYDGSHSIASATIAADGTWTFTLSFNVGAHPLTATQTSTSSSGSLTSPGSTTTTVTVYAPPSAPSNLSSPGSVGISSTATVSGRGTAGDIVTLFDGGVAVGTALVASNGTWSTALGFTTLGRHTLTAQQLDPNSGFSGSLSSSIVVTVVPDPPVITLVTPPAATKTSTPVTVSGTGANGDTVTLYDGPHAIGTAVVAGGTWSITASLAVGGHTLTATQTAPGSLVSAASSAVSVTVYQPTPAPTASAPGTVAAGAAFTVSGTGAAGDTVTVYEGTTALGTATVANNGRWSLSVTLAAAGTHALTAVQVDPDSGFSSSAVAFSVVAVTPPAAPAITYVSTPGHAGFWTTSVTVSGTGVDGDTVTLYSGSTVVGTKVVSGGAWSMTISLSAGSYTLTATQTAAGVTGAASAAVGVTVPR